MSDIPIITGLPFHVRSFLNDKEAMARLDRSCELALKAQLNKNEQDPVLKALADKWKTMDAFSKRELGEKDTVKASDLARQTSQAQSVTVTPGQKAEVTGPATIYGGKVEIEK